MKFRSLKYASLIVTLDPRSVAIIDGMKVMKGRYGRFDKGLNIYFKNHEFDTKSLNMSEKEEKKVIESLMRHPSYGRAFVSAEVKQEPSEEAKQALKEKQEVVKKVADTNPEKKKK